LGTKVPLGAALGRTLLEPVVVVVDVPVAALPTAALNTVPPSAPPAIEPARIVVRTHFFPMFMCFTSFLVDVCQASRAGLREH
jgi:hypothetical protein